MTGERAQIRLRLRVESLETVLAALHNLNLSDATIEIGDNVGWSEYTGYNPKKVSFMADPATRKKVPVILLETLAYGGETYGYKPNVDGLLAHALRRELICATSSRKPRVYDEELLSYFVIHPKATDIMPPVIGLRAERAREFAQNTYLMNQIQLLGPKAMSYLNDFCEDLILPLD